MLIKQISVFVENVPGKLVEVSQILGDNGIDMSALSLADSSDFGILRLIVNDPDKAYQVLRDHAFVVKQSDVIAAVIDDRPGGPPGSAGRGPSPRNLARLLDLRKNVERFLCYPQREKEGWP